MSSELNAPRSAMSKLADSVWPPLRSAELYSVPEDYQSDIDADYTDTLESKRRQAVRLLLFTPHYSLQLN